MEQKNRREKTESRPQWETLDEWIRQQVQGFIQGGLEEGERVCISPLEAVVEGMRVRLADEEVPS